MAEIEPQKGFHILQRDSLLSLKRDFLQRRSMQKHSSGDLGSLGSLLTTEFIETVERIHATSGLREGDWLDLIKCTWKDYFSFRTGKKRLSLDSLERISDFFGLDYEELCQGRVDFQKLSKFVSERNSKLNIPDYYMVAPHGRLRSTITSIEFLEKNFGWRMKHDVLARFAIPETTLTDAFAPISIRLITEICDYLHKRQFQLSDFFLMGAYSYEGNRNGIVGQVYSQMSDYREAFEAFANFMMPMFEHNCSYRFYMTDAYTGVVDVKSNSDIASELKVKALGSPLVCQLKGGIWASLTSYFGMSLPVVTHPLCEHKGDGVCRYIIDFSNCRPLSDSHSLSRLKGAGSFN